jgi:serpin B
MNKGKKGQNLIISPLSIFQILSLTANGAKEQTQLEMVQTLDGEDIEYLNSINYDILEISQKFKTVEIANAVMSKFVPIKEFLDVSEKYCAPFQILKSAQQVNGWCSEKTHGKIPKILDELNSNIEMILLNAVYFKGEWFSKFLPYETKSLPFYNLGSKEINVDTMDQISHFNYYEDKKIQAIELPFKKDYMSAFIILPNEETDINKYIDTLYLNEEYNNIYKKLDYVKVHLQLPKFELEFKQNLNQVLKDLGMYDAFILDVADFSEMREEKDSFINQVIHKTYLKVFEDGCEAAAVTVVEGLCAAALTEEKIFDMKINRPFLFMLKNNKLPAAYDLVFMSKIEDLS